MNLMQTIGIGIWMMGFGLSSYPPFPMGSAFQITGALTFIVGSLIAA